MKILTDLSDSTFLRASIFLRSPSNKFLMLKKNLTIDQGRRLVLEPQTKNFYGLFHPEALIPFGFECAKQQKIEALLLFQRLFLFS